MAAAEPEVIVYRARNIVTGHTYIGFTTKGLAERKRRHLKDARHTSNGYRFHNAIRKYGPENFVFEELFNFQGDEDLAKAYEFEMIAKWQPEYNISNGGEGGAMPDDMRQKISDTKKGRPSPLKGRTLSEETRAKMRAAQAGHPPYNKGTARSAEAIRKTSEANRGRLSPLKGVPRSEEVRAKIGAGNRGKVVSEESRQRMREAQRNRPWEPKEGQLAALEARKRPVQCVADGKIFASGAEADKFYGLLPGSAGNVAGGRAKSSRGMVFIRYEKPSSE